MINFVPHAALDLLGDSAVTTNLEIIEDSEIVEDSEIMVEDSEIMVDSIAMVHFRGIEN